MSLSPGAGQGGVLPACLLACLPACMRGLSSPGSRANRHGGLCIIRKQKHDDAGSREGQGLSPSATPPPPANPFLLEQTDTSAAAATRRTGITGFRCWHERRQREKREKRRQRRNLCAAEALACRVHVCKCGALHGAGVVPHQMARCVRLLRLFTVPWRKTQEDEVVSSVDSWWCKWCCCAVRWVLGSRPSLNGCRCPATSRAVRTLSSHAPGWGHNCASSSQLPASATRSRFARLRASTTPLDSVCLADLNSLRGVADDPSSSTAEHFASGYDNGNRATPSVEQQPRLPQTPVR